MDKLVVNDTIQKLHPDDDYKIVEGKNVDGFEELSDKVKKLAPHGSTGFATYVLGTATIEDDVYYPGENYTHELAVPLKDEIANAPVLVEYDAEDRCLRLGSSKAEEGLASQYLVVANVQVLGKNETNTDKLITAYVYTGDSMSGYDNYFLATDIQGEDMEKTKRGLPDELWPQIVIAGIVTVPPAGLKLQLRVATDYTPEEPPLKLGGRANGYTGLFVQEVSTTHQCSAVLQQFEDDIRNLIRFDAHAYTNLGNLVYGLESTPKLTNEELKQDEYAMIGDWNLFAITDLERDKGQDSIEIEGKNGAGFDCYFSLVLDHETSLAVNGNDAKLSVTYSGDAGIKIVLLHWNNPYAVDDVAFPLYKFRNRLVDPTADDQPNWVPDLTIDQQLLEIRPGLRTNDLQEVEFTFPIRTAPKNYVIAVYPMDYFSNGISIALHSLEITMKNPALDYSAVYLQPRPVIEIEGAKPIEVITKRGHNLVQLEHRVVEPYHGDSILKALNTPFKVMGQLEQNPNVVKLAQEVHQVARLNLRRTIVQSDTKSLVQIDGNGVISLDPSETGKDVYYLMLLYIDLEGQKNPDTKTRSVEAYFYDNTEKLRYDTTRTLKDISGRFMRIEHQYGGGSPLNSFFVGGIVKIAPNERKEITTHVVCDFSYNRYTTLGTDTTLLVMELTEHNQTNLAKLAFESISKLRFDLDFYSVGPESYSLNAFIKSHDNLDHNILAHTWKLGDFYVSGSEDKVKIAAKDDKLYLTGPEMAFFVMLDAETTAHAVGQDMLLTLNLNFMGGGTGFGVYNISWSGEPDNFDFPVYTKRDSVGHAMGEPNYFLKYEYSINVEHDNDSVHKLPVPCVAGDGVNQGILLVPLDGSNNANNLTINSATFGLAEEEYVVREFFPTSKQDREFSIQRNGKGFSFKTKEEFVSGKTYTFLPIGAVYGGEGKIVPDYTSQIGSLVDDKGNRIPNSGVWVINYEGTLVIHKASFSVRGYQAPLNALTKGSIKWNEITDTDAVAPIAGAEIKFEEDGTDDFTVVGNETEITFPVKPGMRIALTWETELDNASIIQTDGNNPAVDIQYYCNELVDVPPSGDSSDGADDTPVDTVDFHATAYNSSGTKKTLSYPFSNNTASTIQLDNLDLGANVHITHVSVQQKENGAIKVIDNIDWRYDESTHQIIIAFGGSRPAEGCVFIELTHFDVGIY